MSSKLLKFPACFGFYIRLLEDLRAGKQPRYRKIHSAGDGTVVRLIVSHYL